MVPVSVDFFFGNAFRVTFYAECTNRSDRLTGDYNLEAFVAAVRKHVIRSSPLLRTDRIMCSRLLSHTVNPAVTPPSLAVVNCHFWIYPLIKLIHFSIFDGHLQCAFILTCRHQTKGLIFEN